MILSILSILLAIASATIIAFDIKRNPQSMKIMNAVWILTALWASIFGFIAYCWFGREIGMKGMSMRDMKGMNMPQRAKWQSVTLSTLHCGAGCTLADIIGSIFLFVVPITLARSTLLGGWVFTYILALIIGVGFQYAAIREMSNLPTLTILIKALKADFLSLTAWQLGMYGWMYLLMFKFQWLGTHSTMSWEFWFAMQQAMLAGFIVALPMNYLLIKWGIKHGM